MLCSLQIHPKFASPDVTAIEVECERRHTVLAFSYRVSGRVGDLAIPPLSASGRTDDLWRHTCFEAFIGTREGDGYFEFNFSPSRQWAAYRFDSYRHGMANANDIDTPSIDATSSVDQFELRATIDIGNVAALAQETILRVALSAVIEKRDGSKTYWALQHPPGKPDFHHRSAFTLSLPITP